MGLASNASDAAVRNLDNYENSTNRGYRYKIEEVNDRDLEFKTDY